MFSVLLFSALITSVLSCQCGISSKTRVYHGKDFEENKFPWLVLIVLRPFGQMRHNVVVTCGGALVGPKTILTAAHCLVYNNQTIHPKNIIVYLGVHNRPKGTLGATTQAIKVVGYKRHPNSARENMNRSDIAILRLGTKAMFSSSVSPICVPHSTNQIKYEVFTVAGWGVTGPGMAVSSKPLEAQVHYINPEECYRIKKTFYNENLKLVGNVPPISKYVLCAKNKHDAADTCMGDSGGPLMANIKGKWYLAGIVSSGFGQCGVKNTAGMYTDVVLNYKFLLENDPSICFEGLRGLKGKIL